ncbi:MAG: sulfatase-like hydrolase/transferase [Christensenellales bacterium]|jgi:arylsulfatase
MGEIEGRAKTLIEPRGKKETGKPNLLFIFTDEQAAKTMGSYGNSQISTPNMDRLAAQSQLFENAYVTQPVCTPSRSTILTGLYPHTNGCTKNNISLRPDTKCFPELADFTGYTTGYFGKWHLGDEVFAQHGFEHWRSIEDIYALQYSPERDKSAVSSYSHYLAEQGYEPDTVNAHGAKCFSRTFAAGLTEEHGKPAYLAGETARFLKENKDEPFALFVNFLEPHMPFTGPRDEQYDYREIPLPESFEEGRYNTENSRLVQMRKRFFKHGQDGMPLKTEEDWKRLIARYWGLISQVDSALGKILDALEENGLDENTIVVYTSDHGDMMGAHRVLTKGMMNEEAVKVPLLLRFPGIAHRRIAQPISQVDLAPTLLEAMGKEVPGFLQGESWMPALSGECEPEGRSVFIQWNPMHTSEDEALEDPVRTVITADGWKYNQSWIGESELFYLPDDPGEMKNLAGDSAFKPIIDRLRDEIKAWRIAKGDIDIAPVDF